MLGVGGLGVEAGADRHQAATECLGKCEDVWSHALRLAGEQPPGPAEPGLDLVDDQQRAVPVAQVPSSGQIAGRRDTDAQFCPE